MLPQFLDIKWIALASIILVYCSINAQNDTIQLLSPTGKFPVGSIIYEWTDETREIQITNHIGDKRTILVQLWYPAQIDSLSKKSIYAPLSSDYQKILTNSFSRPTFTSEIEKAPVLLIAPGRGTERFLYTTIAEELASHGFVVAAVDMPEIGYVIYKDGLLIEPSSKYQPPPGLMGGPYEKVDEFFEFPTQMGFQDMVFAMENIIQLNSDDPNQRFTGKFDVSRIGIFGHSLGGRIGGKFAAENADVKAYISMEGIPPRDIRYEGKLDFTVALLCSSGTWPYAKENYFSLIDNRNAPVYMLELSKVGHNSVTDNPYIYPNKFNYAIPASEGLQLTRKIILQYFQLQMNNNPGFEKFCIDQNLIKFKKYN